MPLPFASSRLYEHGVCTWRGVPMRAIARPCTMLNRRNQKYDYHSNEDTENVILSSYLSARRWPDDARNRRSIDFTNFHAAAGFFRNEKKHDAFLSKILGRWDVVSFFK